MSRSCESPPSAVSVAALDVFGQYVCARRAELGLSRDHLAAALGGVGAPELRDVEDGRARIPSRHLRAWAAALRVDAREFALYAFFHYEAPVYRMLFGPQVPDRPGGAAG